jgi:hypothetical protein
LGSVSIRRFQVHGDIPLVASGRRACLATWSRQFVPVAGPVVE